MVVAAVLFLNRAVRVAVAEISRRYHRPSCRTASRILATAALYCLPWITTAGVVYGPLSIPRWAVGTVQVHPRLDVYLVNEQAPSNTAGVTPFLIDRFTSK